MVGVFCCWHSIFISISNQIEQNEKVNGFNNGSF